MFDFDPSNQARLFYLLLLGMALMIGLFASYRGRLSVALQHAAIWMLIFVGVVIAYGFSDVLTAQLSSAQVQRISEDAVALRRGRNGHFHANLKINGREVEFLVDTGATAMVLSRRDAARVGLDPGRLAFTAPAATANGVVYSAPVELDEVRLGPFVDRNVPAMVNGGDFGSSLLGMRYLDTYARVSLEGDRMILER